MSRTRVVAAAALCALLSGCALAHAHQPIDTSAPAEVAASTPSPTVAPTKPAATPTKPAADAPSQAPLATPSSVVTPGAPTSTPTPKPTPKPTTTASWQAADMRAAIPLISKRYRLSSDYAPASTAGNYGLTPDANSAIERLIAAAHADGVKMEVRSGYRSYATQKTTYDNALRTYSSPAEAMRYNAPPGASEHQTGLAVDMWDGVNRGTAFRGTATDTWLAQNAYKYGFIIRYPKGKEAITGYADEPWHLRYVGVAVAAEFGPRNTLTLEEYLGLA